MFADFPREYELIVYNDGSSDATAEVLAPYADALPVTILGGSEHVGYARAIDALLRARTDLTPGPSFSPRLPRPTRSRSVYLAWGAVVGLYMYIA